MLHLANLRETNRFSAYDEGQEACWERLVRDNCPYAITDPLRYYWFAGYNDAYEDDPWMED